MKTVVVYGGRFQPPHKGHKASFDWLTKRFGDVYISSADKTPGPEDPFTWNEKKHIAVGMGIPSERFIKIANAYSETAIREVLQYDPENTVLVIALSKKDGDRLVSDSRDAGGFALKKDGSRAPIQWLPKKPQPVAKGHFYVVATPTVNFSVAGNDVTGATQIREMYRTANDKQRNKIIADLYGDSPFPIKKLFDKRIGAPVTESLLWEYVDYINKF